MWRWRADGVGVGYVLLGLEWVVERSRTDGVGVEFLGLEWTVERWWQLGDRIGLEIDCCDRGIGSRCTDADLTSAQSKKLRRNAKL